MRNLLILMCVHFCDLPQRNGLHPGSGVVLQGEISLERCQWQQLISSDWWKECPVVCNRLHVHWRVIGRDLSFAQRPLIQGHLALRITFL